MIKWNAPAGRECDATPLLDTMPKRIVACINVWNDLPALQKTAWSWLPHVDAIIAVDGGYDGTGNGPSTDGTRAFFERLPHATVLDGSGLSQCAKRTKYLEQGTDGDLLFIVDADEMVYDGARLRTTPLIDVGWVRVTSTLYAREYGQPRVLAWRPGLHYKGRHHWIWAQDRLLCTHQYGGPGFEHRPVNVRLDNNRHLGRARDRMAVKSTHLASQSAIEGPQIAIPASTMSDSTLGARESMQILMYAYRDDGLAPSRLHTAINRTTPHASVLFKRRPGPFDVPEQYLVQQHQTLLSQAMLNADVYHFHGAMSLVRSRTRRNVPIVFHHHGTLYRTNADEYNHQAQNVGALVLVSNLELLSWADGVDAHFLPNTVPLARYRALYQQRHQVWDGVRPFRIAHSPSKPKKKGTDYLLAAVERLKERNVPIEVVMLHDLAHWKVLDEKATCDAAFDSFWLGMQCSGIEAAAMGMPVIAGDETVRMRYVERFDACPYTFANEVDALEHELFRLVDDPVYRAQEALRVHLHVRDYHDESAVALRYLDLLDSAFHWRARSLVPSRRTAQMVRR